MNEDGDQPRLRLAVANDQSEVERERAKRELVWPLRELAANIIRVVRGAGKPYDVALQCASVISAVERYREKVGHWPTSWEIQEALSISRENADETYDETWSREQASETLVRGALQVAASRLLGQSTQEQRGRSEISEGISELERLREEMRRRLVDEERSKRSKKGKSSKAIVPTKRKPAIE